MPFLGSAILRLDLIGYVRWRTLSPRLEPTSSPIGTNQFPNLQRYLEFFNHLIESLVLGHQGMLSLLHLTNLQAYFDLNNTVLSCILIINTASITLNALAGATPSSFIPLYVGNYTRCSRAPSHVTPNSISCNRYTGSVSCSLKVATAGSLWTSGPLEIIQPSLRLDNRWLRSILRPLSQYILFPNAQFLEENISTHSGIRRILHLNESIPVTMYLGHELSPTRSALPDLWQWPYAYNR